MKNRIWVFSLILIIVSTLSCLRTTERKLQWHHPLYMANNNYWRQRIPATIRNNMGREIPGDPVALIIGKSRGQAPLVGELAEGIRVTTADGSELTYRVTDSNGNLIERGPVPENSIITFPVECSPYTNTTHFIYFDNPSAWSIGDFFKTDSKINDSITVIVMRKEKLDLKEIGKTGNWFDDNPDNQNEWQLRAAMKTINMSYEKQTGKLICVDIEGVINRLHSEIDENTAIQITDGLHPVPYFKMGNFVFFNQDIPSWSEKTNYIYFNSDIKTVNNYKALDDKNVIQYSDFESQSLSGWKGDIESGDIEISTTCKEGKGSVQLQIPSNDKGKEITLEKKLPVQAGNLYFIGAWMKLSDNVEHPAEFNTGIRQRTIRLQFLNKEGKSEGTLQKLAVIPERYSDYPGTWWFVHKLIMAPENADSVQLQLVNSFPGTVWFDNIIFAEVKTGVTSALLVERKAVKELNSLTVWQKDPIVKVFQDDLPAGAPSEVAIKVARNEVEPLQLVIRSPKEYKQLHIKVNPPSDSKGNKLGLIDVGVVGYVPINFPSNYYGARDNPNPWRIKYPSNRESGSDGWTGMWPDPILPVQSFDLSANSTQPIWIEFKVPKDAIPGIYTGQIQLIQNDEVIKEIPLSVHVWDFELPDKSNLTALYDVRGGTSDKEKRAVWKILADHRLAPDRITPEPSWVNVKGEIIYDFTEYDKAASYFFDTLNFSHTYSPGFYLFGWGNPPAIKFDEKPYPGEYPYEDADRSKLRPEFKKVYQSAIKAYWNHMKEKGWADKVLVYISDEPHTDPEITAQMKALCDMIHEVDTKIPIYVSSWWHRPEYARYIDVWGVSSHGSTWGRPVPLSDFINIKKDGGRFWFTTDGKLCTDTPYLGFERMTPHYAFKFGAEGYEFWGCNWYTFNPFDYGWHNHIRQSSTPGKVSWTRYPNGDGYIIYPGHYIGLDFYVASIRLKLAREGVEDYEYLHYLDALISLNKKVGKDVSQAEKALENAKNIVIFPTAEGRFSTEYLPDPYIVLRVREQVALAIEGLLK